MSKKTPKPHNIRIAGMVSMEVRDPKGRITETMEPFCYRIKKELPKGKKFVIRCGVEAV